MYKEFAITSIIYSPRCTPLPNTHVCYGLPGRKSSHSCIPQLASNTTLGSVGEINITILFQLNYDPATPSECVELIQYIGCLTAEPPCDAESQLPLQVCSRDCDVLKSLLHPASPCNSFLNEMSTAVADEGLSKLLEVVMAGFNCSKPSTYHFPHGVDFESETCTGLLDPATQGKQHTRNILRLPFNLYPLIHHPLPLQMNFGILQEELRKFY